MDAESKRNASSEGGSTVVGAALNLTNAIVGAGCVGLGGALAQSGGGASLLMIGLVAILSKMSFDMLIELGLLLSSRATTSSSFVDDPSFEAVGKASLGDLGVAAVTFGKGFFSFGCMVAYIVIVKDNVAPALFSLTGWPILSNAQCLTIVLATFAILPMCLQKDLSALENLSKLKIATYGGIAAVVIRLYLQNVHGDEGGATVSDRQGFFQHWLTVKPGLLPNTGTFLFAFVSQHVVHLVFLSLCPRDRNLTSFRRVSTLGVVLAASIMVGVGLPVYLTFWEGTSSSMFLLYPASKSAVVNAARLFLSMGVILTYPMPLFGLRDCLVRLLPTGGDGEMRTMIKTNNILPEETTSLIVSGEKIFPSQSHRASTPMLIAPLHAGLTIILWLVSLILALSVPSLGVVLNVVGCISGSLIAFLLPGLCWIRLVGWSVLAVFFCIAGTVLGCLGTYYSLVQLSR